MSKIKFSLSKDEQSEVVSVTFKQSANNSAAKFKEIMEWVAAQASFGTGITLSFKNNGGEEKKMYIDGDGPDKILEVK